MTVATQTIHGYTAAATIDPAADYLLIDPASSGNYLKINRNTLMGVSGTPADISTAQNFTNKSLNNTNSITVKDGSFTLENSTDTTKIAVFSLADITAGTTRIYTLPNATDTLAGIAATQTFTNKTLTAPTISGGTIDNAAITVDSISGHTTSTIVTVGGVQMNNGTIGTSGAVVAASIAAGAVQPNGLQSGAGTGWGWQAYTPTWTASGSNPSIGNGTLNGWYIQTGKRVDFYVKVVGGSSTNFGSGSYNFALPVQSVSSYSFGPIGNMMINHTSTSTAYMGFVFIGSSATVFNARDSNGSNLLTNAAPATWAQGDTLSFSGSYWVP